MAKIKAFFGKIKEWFVKHKPTKRRLIQIYAALLFNANVKGFFTGKIYRGPTKNMCVPGLNCYSCPGAVGSCPLGALQNALAASGTRAPAYVFGIIVLFGLLLGRTICGFLCPFGLIQDLLHKIRTPKLKKSRFTRVFSYFKYVLLALLIALPLIYHSVPAFCKYICPAGTLEGAVGLLSNFANSDFYAMLGYLFSWKFILLVLFVVACIFIYRFFCRFFCPLGAIYGFFCKISLLGIKLDKQKCIDCGLCIQTCKMDIRYVGDHECIQCGACIDVCPTKAISWKGSKLFLHPSSVESAPVEEKPITAMLQPQETTEGCENEQTVMQNIDQTQVQVAPVRKKNPVKTVRIIAQVLALVVLLGALVYYNFLAPEESVTVYREGDKCQDFTLQLFDSASEETEKFSVLESRGKVTVINYWYTSCDPCVEELPHFEKVHKDYLGEINMVAVHGYGFASNANIQKFLDENGWNEWTMMFALDLEKTTFEMLGGKSAYPLTVVLDAEGVITFVKQGKLEEQLLRDKIEEAMQK